MYLTSLPPEILLRIISHLKLEDLARIRQACKYLQAIAQDRSIWEALLADQRLYHPIPPWLDLPDNSLQSQEVPQASIERAVMATHRVAQAWPRVRPSAPFKVRQKMGDALLSLEMFLDRWLLMVYAEGLMYLWDTASDPTTLPGPSGTSSRFRECARMSDQEENRQTRWTFCATQLSEDGQRLIVMLNVTPSLEACCHVYEVPLRSSSVSFQFLISVPLNQPGVIRAISFTDNMLILSCGNVITLVDIVEHQDYTALYPFSDGIEGLWNTIIGIRVLNRYIFSFKTCSIELHDLDCLLRTKQRRFTATALCTYSFRNIFRIIKFSTPTIIVGEGVEIKFEIFVLDSLEALFNYHIRLHACPGRPPDLTVLLLGIYPLCHNVVSRFIQTGPSSAFPTPFSIPTNGPRDVSRSSILDSRGFIVSYALGSRGSRAFWVERLRGGCVREIQVWSRSTVFDDEVLVDEGPREFEKVTVHSITKDDDITHCALSESTGLIVWGDVTGQLWFMEVTA